MLGYFILTGYLSIVASLPTDIISKALDGRDVESKFLSIPFSVKRSNISASSTGDHIKRAAEAPTYKGLHYFSVDLLVGSNQQPIGLIVDTESADAWVVDVNAQCQGAYTCKDHGTYDPAQSSTSHNLDETFYIYYIDTSQTSGNFYTDDVTIPNGPTLKQFQFGDGTVVAEFYGILGLGMNVTEQPAYTGQGPAYLNFPFALRNQGYIAKAAYSLYLNDAEASSGNLLFGGIDNAKIEGGLLELPGVFYDRLGINISSFSVDGSVHSADTGFVFDSCYPFSALPSSIVDAIGTALSIGGTYPYSADCVQPDKNITFTFNSGDDQKDVNVPYSSFIQPGGPVGGSGNTCNATLIVSSDGSDYNDLPTIGQDIMRSFYIVYDVEGNNISVGQAIYTTDSDISPIQ